MYSTRKLSQLTDVKQIKSFIRNTLEFFVKCPRAANKDTKIVTF